MYLSSTNHSPVLSSSLLTSQGEIRMFVSLERQSYSSEKDLYQSYMAMSWNPCRNLFAVDPLYAFWWECAYLAVPASCWSCCSLAIASPDAHLCQTHQSSLMTRISGKWQIFIFKEIQNCSCNPKYSRNLKRGQSKCWGPSAEGRFDPN